MADGDMMDDWESTNAKAHASRCHYCGEPIDGEWVSFRRADGELAYAHESACPK